MNRPELSQLAGLLGHRLSAQLEASYGQATQQTADHFRISPLEVVARAKAGDRAVLEPLLAAACIGETYFFRHPEHFGELERCARAAAAAGRPFSSAWSVGCSTGEEAWSIALTLAPLSAGLRVVGSDISPRALERARTGQYSAWSVRGISGRTGALLHHGSDGFEVPAPLRPLVSFAELNLASGRVVPPAGLPAAVDVIFCRNVLVYLEPARAAEVVLGLAGALAEGGLLVLSALDAPGGAPGLEALGQPGIFTRRPALAREKARPTAPAPRPQPPRTPTVPAARSLADAGDLDGALGCCRALGDDPDGLLLAASIHSERQEHARADLLLRRLLARLPDHVGGNLQLALVAAQRADRVTLTQARQRLERVLLGRTDEQAAGYEDLTAGHVRCILAELSEGEP